MGREILQEGNHVTRALPPWSCRKVGRIPGCKYIHFVNCIMCMYALFWYFPLLHRFRDLKDNLWTYLPCCMTIVWWMRTRTVLTSCRALYLRNSMFLSWHTDSCFKMKTLFSSLIFLTLKCFLSIFLVNRYVERILYAERDKMKCCSIEYSLPKQSSQAFVYGGILLAGFLIYSLVIFFSAPVR